MNSQQLDVQSEIHQLRLEVAQINKQRTSGGVLQTLLASNMDGYITPGDIIANGAASVLLTGCGLAIGTGLGIFAHVLGKPIPGPELGTGLGLLVSGVTVGARVIMDLWGKDTEATQPIIADEITPAIVKMGLQIDDGRQHVLLLHAIPRSLVLRMAKATARAYYAPGGAKQNFSQRQLGQPWGEHLPVIKEKLTALGYLEVAKNNTLKVTDSGAVWLMKVMAEV